MNVLWIIRTLNIYSGVKCIFNPRIWLEVPPKLPKYTFRSLFFWEKYLNMLTVSHEILIWLASVNLLVENGAHMRAPSSSPWAADPSGPVWGPEPSPQPSHAKFALEWAAFPKLLAHCRVLMSPSLALFQFDDHVLGILDSRPLQWAAVCRAPSALWWSSLPPLMILIAHVNREMPLVKPIAADHRAHDTWNAGSMKTNTTCACMWPQQASFITLW